MTCSELNSYDFTYILHRKDQTPGISNRVFCKTAVVRVISINLVINNSYKYAESKETASRSAGRTCVMGVLS